MFQSTPPRGGRRYSASEPMSLTIGFNPRPRAGGDAVEPDVADSCATVSIHAPARGATRRAASVGMAADGFNPRPRAGGDRHATPEPRRSGSFNPRPRAGGDVRVHRRRQLDAVSIHAPARGATAASHRHRRAGASVSIHAPARGATSLRRRSGLDRMVSIHAPARGATLRADCDAEPRSCFNPRPRAGGDRALTDRAAPADRVSIHAPARGATGPTADGCEQVSIHAPAGGDVVQRISAIDVSIHAPARGATADVSRAASHERSFNPRPRAGGDRVEHGSAGS